MPNSFAFVLPFSMLLHPMLQFVMLHGTFLLQEYAADLAVPCCHVFTACAHDPNAILSD